MTDDLSHFLARFGLTASEALDRSPIARVWAVTRSDGTPAVLKIYTRADRGNERCGTSYLRAMKGRGAVAILADSGPAVLMERLCGPSLGDVARSGDEARAAHLLAETARHLHRQPVPQVPDLAPLADGFATLFELPIDADCPSGLRRDFTRARALAKTLLDSTITEVPLHGDLHHDNVILTDRGPRVFDAKGYRGDPAFELANALRHPRGLQNITDDPEYLPVRASLFAKAVGVSRQRLLRWAAVKCAQSMAWRAEGRLRDDREAGLLARLFGLLDR